MTPNWKTEFPDYDNEQAFRWMQKRLEWLGFTDSSWHNDTCPSLYRELSDGDFVKVFIQYRNPELRELPDAPGFTVIFNHGESARDFDCISAAGKLAVHLAITLGRE